MSEWISVKDELPPCGEMVTLYTTYKEAHSTIGYLYKHGNKKPYFIFFAWDLSRVGYYDYGRFICPGNEYVTHWMPLPEPPKEENHG